MYETLSCLENQELCKYSLEINVFTGINTNEYTT